MPRKGQSLYNWCIENGEYGQQLLQEFQGIDEQGNSYQPTEIARSSNKKILWKCSKGHKWYATVKSRIYIYIYIKWVSILLNRRNIIPRAIFI